MKKFYMVVMIAIAALLSAVAFAQLPAVTTTTYATVYGEVVRSRKSERIVEEIRLKVYVYNLMLNLARS